MPLKSAKLFLSNSSFLWSAYSILGRLLTQNRHANGIHHATSAKTLLLMTGSFALSIYPFLSFTVLIDFVYQQCIGGNTWE